MSNHCYIAIYLVGSNAAIKKAESGLEEIFESIWEEAKNDNKIHLPRKKSPKHYWRLHPPAFGYYLWYPWGPPSLGLAKVAADNPDVILANMYDEPGIGFRGQQFYADGVIQAGHHGPYGPDGHKFYDEVSPLPDFGTLLEYYTYTRRWQGEDAAFAEAEKPTPLHEDIDDFPEAVGSSLKSVANLLAHSCFQVDYLELD